MTIMHETSRHRHAPARRRGRFHKLATLVAAIGLSAVALHWAIMRLGERVSFLEGWRFADALALVVAASILCLTLRFAWDAAHGGSERP